MASHKGKFSKYAMVGVANTAIYVSLLWLFLELSTFSYAVSVGLAFGIAINFHYFANKYFTFDSQSQSASEIARYLAMATLNYSVSLLIVWLCLDIFDLSAFFASIVSASAVVVMGYLISFFWVFRNEDSGH